MLYVLKAVREARIARRRRRMRAFQRQLYRDTVSTQLFDREYTAPMPFGFPDPPGARGVPLLAAELVDACEAGIEALEHFANAKGR